MKLTRRVSCLSPSLTLALTAKAKAMQAEGRDVVSLGAGEPDFDTPDFIKERAIADIRAGQTKYTASRGTADVLKALSEIMARDYGLEYSTKEVMLSTGGKHVLYNAFMALVEDGDEVVLPSPYWLSYPEQIKCAGGVPVIVTCGPEAGFKMTAAQLRAAITPRTVAVVLNSPSNPTGATYSRAELLSLGEVLLEHPRVTLISDDLYMHLVYGGAKFHSLVKEMPELRPRTLIVNGLSKAWAMTGWRLGWAAAPAALIDAMDNLQSHSTSNVTTFCQGAAAVALRSDRAFLPAWVAEYDRRRRLVVEGLRPIPGVSLPCEPDGAFYAFPDVSQHYGRTIGGVRIGGSLDFAAALLERQGVALIPGAVFGEDRCVRLSYATSIGVLQKAIDRMRAFCA